MVSSIFLWNRRKTLTGSPDPTRANGTNKPCNRLLPHTYWRWVYRNLSHGNKCVRLHETTLFVVVINVSASIDLALNQFKITSLVTKKNNVVFVDVVSFLVTFRNNNGQKRSENLKQQFLNACDSLSSQWMKSSSVYYKSWPLRVLQRRRFLPWRHTRWRRSRSRLGLTCWHVLPGRKEAWVLFYRSLSRPLGGQCLMFVYCYVT